MPNPMIRTKHDLVLELEDMAAALAAANSRMTGLLQDIDRLRLDLQAASATLRDDYVCAILTGLFARPPEDIRTTNVLTSAFRLADQALALRTVSPTAYTVVEETHQSSSGMTYTSPRLIRKP
jgi:hypothetical protein